MGGCRCSYRNCTNTTKTRENLHFFHYPVKQKERCKKWIENANKPQFYDLDEDQLRNKVICETHFEDCFFPNVQRKRLLQGAVPTLDGDCELITQGGKIQDVQVLPANADGTIFVLETNNMPENFHSEKIESYIYTNSGLVLPIKKCGEFEEFYKEEIEVEEPQNHPKKLKLVQEAPQNISENLETNYEPVNYVFHEESVTVPVAPPPQSPPYKFENQTSTDPIAVPSEGQVSDDLICKAMGSKYVKKIKQHSKDIAKLKRMLRSQTQNRKPTNVSIMNILRRQIPPTLAHVVNLNLNVNLEPSLKDMEFFSDIFKTSPEVYQILSGKYKWNLPNPQLFLKLSANKSNGHLSKTNIVDVES